MLENIYIGSHYIKDFIVFGIHEKVGQSTLSGGHVLRIQSDAEFDAIQAENLQFILSETGGLIFEE